MKRMAVITVGILGILAAGCGDNLGPSSGGPDDPTNLRAVAVDSATIRLQWSAPASATDSLFAGYTIEYLGGDETLGKTALSYVATGLPQGQTAFRLLSRFTNGRRSAGVSINWAPAYRYDQGITLIEYLDNDATRACGLDVGTASTNPAVMSFASPGAQLALDLFLWGGGNNPATLGAPLELRSASLYAGIFKLTLGSTVENTASSLDFPIAAFPAIDSFTRLQIPVQNNTIYYLRVTGDASTYYYARLHVKVMAGDVAPNRRVTVTLSLQKTPYLQIASAGPPAYDEYAMALPFAGR